MKKIILSGTFALVGLSCLAQGGDGSRQKRTPEERADQYTAWIAKTVTLTDDQKTKVAAVNLKYAKLNEEARSADQGNRASMSKDIKANDEQRDAELKGILTTVQFQAYITAKQQMEEQRKARRANN
jgi:periplasmic protein CpxP/Spy